MKKLLWSVILATLACVTLHGQIAYIPKLTVPYDVHSGYHTAPATEISSVVFSEEIYVEDAPWLQLEFGNCNLGEKSYIRISAPTSKSPQILTTELLKNFQNYSIRFKGSSVKVTLVAHPADHAVFFSINNLSFGTTYTESGLKPPDESPSIESICQDDDDRVSSSDNAVGRLVDISNPDFWGLCTGWLTANNAVLTAGHCIDENPVLQLEFNVPLSDPDGGWNDPLPEDVYPVEIVEWQNNGTGADWAVLRVLPNTITGETAFDRQQAFYRMSDDVEPAIARVTGHGVDGPPPCWGDRNQSGCDDDDPPRNEDNATQQTSTGTYDGGIWWPGDFYIIEYEIDTQGGNSGSPVISNGTTTTMGIHNSGGCDGVFSDNNKGTWFDHPDLRSAIADFPGTNTWYIDNGHPTNWPTGDILSPFDVVSDVSSIPTSDPLVQIVAGIYNETLTISNPMTLTAPVGLVSIGGSPLVTTELPSSSTLRKTQHEAAPESGDVATPMNPIPFGANK